MLGALTFIFLILRREAGNTNVIMHKVIRFRLPYR